MKMAKSLWLNTGDLNDGDLFDCGRRISPLALAENSALKLYDAGAVVIAMYGATIGKLGVLQFSSTVNQACCVFQEGKRITPRFLFYWLLGSRSHIISLASGGGQPNISQDTLRGLRLACPLAPEQTAIAAFLDRETAKIDALVEEQQRLIALLKEKRQAVISHAVTKGLDPSTPTKDSGVEWLGEVPAHWAVGPLKRWWSVTDCKHLTAEFVADGIPLASIREVQGRYVDLDDAKLTTEEFYEQMIEGGRRPRPGDLIFTRNATVGEVAQVTDAHPSFAMGQDVCLLRKLDDNASSDFIWHVLRSSLTGVQIGNLTIGSTFKRINVEEIRNLRLPHPPSKEQHEIASVLDREIISLEALTTEANAAIGLLQERRSALISAAVTGKIDVRLVSVEAEAA
jgi:type I restriction enzyme S subunit